MAATSICEATYRGLGTKRKRVAKRIARSQHHRVLENKEAGIAEAGDQGGGERKEKERNTINSGYTYIISYM